MTVPAFRRRTAPLALAVILASAVAPAQAAEPSPYAGLVPVETATLAETRGGMRVGGFTFDIGVAISTALDEGLDLTSRFQAVGDRLTRTTVSGPAEAVAGAVPGAVSALPDGGVSWRAADGLTVLHDPAGLGASTVLNRLDNQTIRQRLEINIRVTNFRERLGAIRTGRAVDGILRDVRAAAP